MERSRGTGGSADTPDRPVEIADYADAILIVNFPQHRVDEDAVRTLAAMAELHAAHRASDRRVSDSSKTIPAGYGVVASLLLGRPTIAGVKVLELRRRHPSLTAYAVTRSAGCVLPPLRVADAMRPARRWPVPQRRWLRPTPDRC